MVINNFVRVCCDIVVEKDGKVLMGKRGNVFGKGSWALVGGHLELNETTKGCVDRELMEETSIVPTRMEYIGVINDIPGIAGQDNHYIRFVYLVTEFSGSIINKEPDKCEGWKWFDKDKIPEPLFVGHVKVLKLYLNGRYNILME